MFNSMTNKFLTATALAMMTVACAQKADEPLKYGQLSVSLSGGPSVEVVTKADALDKTSEDARAYTVCIFNKADAAEPMYSASYYDFETKTLPLGTYYVTAENCGEDEAESADGGKGMKRIAGQSADVTLAADALTGTATVECVVTNALVSVQFDESVVDRFTDLKVTLAGDTKKATVTQTATDVVTENWFNPQTLTYTISGTFTGSGMNKTVDLSKSIELAAKNNILLLVKVNLENGQLTPSITIDTQIDEPTVENGEFNPYQ